MQHIMVTGGAGFIGSNIAGALADAGAHRIVVVDDFGSGEKWRNLSKHHIYEIIAPHETFQWLDANKATLEAIIHMGAVSSTTETDVDRILATNFTLSRQLWNWASHAGTRFIYASSAATYGGGEAGFDDDGSPEALLRLRPLNAYGWSKHLFDQFVATAVRVPGEKKPKQWVGLKFFNVYGPNEYHKDKQQSVIAQIYPHAKYGRPVRLFKSHSPNYKDGGQLRDFVYVKDCVEVVRWLLEHPAINGLFNLGSGKARTFEELAAAAFAAVGKPMAIHYEDTPEPIRVKYQYFTEANMSRLHAVGYTKPFTSLEQGVKDYVLHYLSKEDPYF